MKVLIGITSKNRAEILPRAIESALNQSCVNKEIWVFDDASNDGTIHLKDKYSQVNWILSDEPKGYVYARNLMMRQENFDLFCSLDDDSWFLENDLLDKAVKYMQDHPQTGAIAFDILSPDKNEKTINDIVITQTSTYIGCGHLIRLSAAKAVGFYIPNPGYYGGEEKDMCIRLWDNNYQVIKFNGGYVWHDKTPVARDLPRQHRSGVCNDLIFCIRRAPTLILIPYLSYKILSHIRFAVRYKKGILINACFKGIGDFFSSLFKGRLYRYAVKLVTLQKFLKLS